jgi:hypothetical protein
MADHEPQLEEVWSEYRAAFPDREPAADFIPRLWARIEGRSSFTLVFGRLARLLVTAAAAACLLLAALNMAPHPARATAHTRYATYTDVLTAETMLERTYYSDSSRPEAFPIDFRQ